MKDHVREEIKRLCLPPAEWRKTLTSADRAWLDDMRRAAEAREDMKRHASTLPEGKKRGWIGGGY